MTNEDEFLERIVAGIHAVTAHDADVRWNDKIGGRQFDVSVRFKMGPLRYLAVIEVKNRTRKASAEDLDAFNTKASDQYANKLVFVTAAGFQSGAKAVARRHGIELFTVTFDTEAASIPPELGVITFPPTGPGPHEPMHIGLSDPTLSANVDSVVVVYASGRRLPLTDESSQLTYYTGKARLADGRTLYDVIQQPLFDLAEGEVRACAKEFNPPLGMIAPDRFVLESGPIRRLEWKLTGRMMRWITGNSLIDPAAFSAPVVYTNALTDEVLRFALHQLPLGIDPICAGKFYCCQQPLQYLYCSQVAGDWVRLHIVESFQLGQLARGTFKVTLPDTRHLILVRDKKLLSRLEGRLDDFRRDPDLSRGLNF